MMLSNNGRSTIPAAVFVLACETFQEEAGATRAVTSSSPAKSGLQAQDRADDYGLTPAGTRLARWASLDPGDRKVFNNWALWVAAFYSAIIVSLLAAILLGTHAPADQRTLTASPMVERSSPQWPAPATGSTGK